MSIPVTCECGRHFEIPEAHAGQLVQCSGCGREFLVPEPKPIPDAELIPRELEPGVTSGAGDREHRAGRVLLLRMPRRPAWPTGHRRRGTPSGRALLLRVPQRPAGDPIRPASADRHPTEQGAAQGPEDGDRGDCSRGSRMPLHGVARGVGGAPARAVGRQAWCASNLKQIGIAILEYHQSYGCLPPAAIRDKDGRPLLSWRVAMLSSITSEYSHIPSRRALGQSPQPHAARLDAEFLRLPRGPGP